MERLSRAAAVLGIRVPRQTGRPVRYILTVALAAVLLPSGSAIAAGSLTSASVALSDPTPNATSSYFFTGSSVDTATAIKCVQTVWSDTASGTHAPSGFSGASGSVDAASSSLITGTITGWTLTKSDGATSTGQKNIYQYTRTDSTVTPASTSGRTFVLTGLTNPSTAGTAYYFSINTYSDTGCSAPIDNAVVTFINTSGSQLSLTVDPSLSFTVNSIGQGASCDGTTTTNASGAATIPFGTVSTGSNAVVCQDLQAATNAHHGYTIYLRYTGPPTNAASDTIADAPGSNASPAAFPGSTNEAYGYSTDDATLSNCSGTCNADRFTNYDSLGHQGWAAVTTTNAEIGFETTGVSATHYHVGHQVGISSTTNPGIYTTTIIYTCTPVY